MPDKHRDFVFVAFCYSSTVFRVWEISRRCDIPSPPPSFGNPRSRRVLAHLILLEETVGKACSILEGAFSLPNDEAWRIDTVRQSFECSVALASSHLWIVPVDWHGRSPRTGRVIWPSGSTVNGHCNEPCGVGCVCHHAPSVSIGLARSKVLYCRVDWCVLAHRSGPPLPHALP